jgi:hypothetical protein
VAFAFFDGNEIKEKVVEALGKRRHDRRRHRTKLVSMCVRQRLARFRDDQYFNVLWHSRNALEFPSIVCLEELEAEWRNLA